MLTNATNATNATKTSDLTLTLTAILETMERAAEADSDLNLAHDAAQGRHIVKGLVDTLTVAWQSDCDNPGWAWWLVTRNPETGHPAHEESDILDSLDELESALARLI